MAQGPINLSLFGSKVARGTPNPEFLQFFFSQTLWLLSGKIRPALSTVPSCDAITFNGQEQLCPLTCAGRRDLSNYTRMSTIQSSKLEKRPKKPCNTDLKSPWKVCSITHLPFWAPNSKMMKGFSETLATKVKPTKCPASWKKMRQGKRKGREGEKAKSESRKCCATFKPKNYVEILLSLQALIFAPGWKGRGSVQPGNGFVGRFSS